MLDELAKALTDLIRDSGLDALLGTKANWRAVRAGIVIVPVVLAVLALNVVAKRGARWPRALLDGLFRLSGGIAGLALLVMLGVIVAQMVARWTGQAFPGSNEYAGYMMAVSAFFGLAYALNAGSHIRVNMLLSRLGRFRNWGEAWCLLIGALLATYLARYAARGALYSVKLNDVSQGQDATPLWIPQIAMVAGCVLLAIALWDNLFRLLLSGDTNIREETVEDSPAAAHAAPATPEA